MHRKKLIYLLVFTITLSYMPSCRKAKSGITGTNYNDRKWGGFEYHEYKGQETGPGLMFIEGGTFVMGSNERDVTYEYNNVERRVTVHSFYMDETEVSNLQYREYIWWLGQVFQDDVNVMRDQLPDTLIWREKLAYNEPYVEYYFRHPAYQHYPVVGVNWLQATNFAKWRSDYVNAMILDREKLITYNRGSELEENNFNKKAYYAGQYEFSNPATKKSKMLKDYTQKKGRRTQIRMEDGIFLPDYRLPTEAEWEYAALALVGNRINENLTTKRIYSWNGDQIRMSEKTMPGVNKEDQRGKILANGKRGKGDQGGIAGQQNDGGEITTTVFSYWPNDYGLYNMAANVSEWVMDVYRPFTQTDGNDLNTFRGNVYKTAKLDQYEEMVDKDSLGRIVMRDVTPTDNVNRRNYQTADNIGFKDEEDYDIDFMYEFGKTTLVNNKARVYKGGSWNDRTYFMVPGTRRFLDEKFSKSTLGFRCAMTRVGSPAGNGKKRNQNLPSSGAAKKRRKKLRYK